VAAIRKCGHSSAQSSAKIYLAGVLSPVMKYLNGYSAENAMKAVPYGYCGGQSAMPFNICGSYSVQYELACRQKAVPARKLYGG